MHEPDAPTIQEITIWIVGAFGSVAALYGLFSILFLYFGRSV